MRRVVFLLSVGVCLLFATQPWNSMVSGLVAGLGMGMVVLLLVSALGGSLGRWLQQTRLEDQILSMDTQHAVVNPSPLEWLDHMEQGGLWMNDWRQPQPVTPGGETRRFEWEDELPSAEILAAVER